MAIRAEVVVIGAGVSGLAAASYLCAEGFNVAVLEQKRGPGGLWNPQTGRHWAKPVYNTLETNIPRQLMTFSDYPWDREIPLYAHNTQVNDYLNTYAAALHRRYSKNLKFLFNCRVVTAHQVNMHKTETWEIEVEPADMSRSSVKKSVYSRFLVVAAGNYHDPFKPDYEGATEWAAQDPSSVIHAQQFTGGEMYKDKNVLIIGYSASGFDISTQIAPYARNVVVSTRRQGLQLAPGVRISVGATKNFDIGTNRTVYFEGGASFSNIDQIIYCTGYRYDFDFLKQRDGLTRLIPSQSATVPNLYQHILYMPDRHVQNTSLAFVGLLQQAFSFTVAEAQSALVARVFASRTGLLTRNGQRDWYAQDMQNWSAEQPNAMSAAMVSYHIKGDMGKEYVNELWGLSKNAEPQKSGSQGKRPPYWCRCFDQARELNRMSRAQFKALTEEEKKKFKRFEDAFGQGCMGKCSKRLLPKEADETNLLSCYL
ncbi:hypothetical protein BST61_g1676 [Cercospora zeina]